MLNQTKKTRLYAFTLIELIVVMIIIGITVLVAVPMVGDNSDIRLGAAANQITADLRYSQTCAITRRKPSPVTFSTADNTYLTQNENGDFSINHTDKKLNIQSASFDGSNTIWFDHMGTPYSGDVVDGTPLLNGTIIIQSGDKEMTINVEPVTGKISIRE